jgi:DNA end-binding protein Ku
MMQAIWKGFVSFGLVSVPVRLFSATREHNLPLHQVHARDGARVRLRRFCEAEDAEVPYDEITKGYEAPDGRVVALSEQDLAELPVPSKRVIDVLAFVDAERIDPLMFAKAYYVGPERAGVKPYALLRDALAAAGQVAVTKVTLSTRESLAVLRAHDEVLVLQTVLWPDEVRTPVDVAPPETVAIRPQELKMARSLMDTMSEGFDLAEVRDEYQAALTRLVQARLDGAEPPRETPDTETGGTVIDLMAALERSVTEAKSARRGSAGTAKKTVAKKTVAKKTTAKRTPATKAATPPARRRTS